MHSFKNFLIESLDTPVEFYMTDETIMPHTIVAACDIDGTTYGMSLRAANWNSVYYSRMFLIKNGKKRAFKFEKPNQIRRALSTYIRFMESSIPFVPQKMKGIVIELPNARDAQKMNSFIQKIVNRSYIKTFRALPTVKKASKAKNFLFIHRRMYDPKSIFDSSIFTKNFDFSGSKAVFTPDEDTEITPKIPEKAKANLVPSKKYAFQKLVVESDLDLQLLENIHTAEKVVTEYNYVPYLLKLVGQDSKYSKDDENKILTVPFHFILHAAVFNNIKYTLYNTSEKLKTDDKNTDNYMYAQTTIFKAIKNYEKVLNSELTEKAKEALLNYNTLGFITGTVDQLTIPVSKYNEFAIFIQDTKYDFLTTVLTQLKKSPDLFESKRKAQQKTALKFNTPLAPVTIKGYVSEEEYDFSNASDMNVEHDVSSIMKDLSNNDPGIEKYLSTSPAGTKVVRNYTGNAYRKMNKAFRSIIESGHTEDAFAVAANKTMTNHILKHAVNIQRPMYVFRSARIPGLEEMEAGDDIIDPGFMSATIRSNMNFGPAGKPKLFIYLPAGTPILPVYTFEKSAHSSEKEVILPAMSILKIYEKFSVNTGSSERTIVKCVYTGNALAALKKAAKDNVKLDLNKLNEEFETNDMNREDKWTTDISVDEMEKVKKILAKLDFDY